MLAELDPARLSQVVVSALDLAAMEVGPGRPFDTRDVLLALMRVDLAGDWQRLWLAFDSPDAIARAPVRDPSTAPADQWGSTAMTASCSRALAAAVRLADLYETEYVSAGLAAIGLVGDPGSAAATALLLGDRGRHPELLEVMQEASVGATLSDLPGALRQAFTPEPAARRGPATDDGHRLDEVIARLGGPAAVARADAVALVGAAIDVSREPTLAMHLERMELTGATLEQARSMVPEYTTAPAAEVIRRAQDRFDTSDPSAAQLIVAATARPAPAVRGAAWLLGVSPAELAFEAADADARQRPRDETVSLTLVLVILHLITTVLLARYAIQHEQWWKLLLVPLIWSVNGRLPNWWAFLVAVLLYPLTELPVAVVALAGALTELALGYSQRRAAFFRTGIRLTGPQWRKHLRRGHHGAARWGTAVIRWRRFRRMGLDGGEQP
jgi:hypothetical protein